MNAVEFMIDSRFLVACYGNDVVIWDALSGYILCTEEDVHDGVVFDVATCPKDARRFATASEDGTAVVWMLSVQKKTCIQMHTMRSNTEAGMSSIAWSPDGRFIATGSSPGGTRIWLAATGTPMAVLGSSDQNATMLSWSPGSQYFVVIGGTDKGYIYEPLSKEELPYRLVSHDYSVTACAWSRQGNLIATGDASGNIMIWEVIETSSLSYSSNESSDNAYSSDNACSSDDDDLGLSEAERELNAHYNLILEQERRTRLFEERRLRLVEYHRDAPASNPESVQSEIQSSQSLSEENEQLSSQDHEVDPFKEHPTLQDAKEDTANSEEENHSDVSLSFQEEALPADVLLNDEYRGTSTKVVGTRREMEMIDRNYQIVHRGSGRMTSKRDIDELETTQLSLQRIKTKSTSERLDDEKNFAEDSSSSSFRTFIRRDESFVPLTERFSFKHHITCVRLSNKTGKLLVCMRNKVIYVWNDPLTSKCATYILHGHNSNVLCAAWTPNENMILSGSSDCSAVVWDLRSPSGNLFCRLVGHISDILCCAWSPVEENIAATGSMDSTVIIWNIRDNNTDHATPLHKLVLHSLYIRGIDFSCDGRFLYSASSDKTVRCWLVEEGRCVFTTPQDLSPEDSSIMSIACSNVSKKFVIGCRNGKVRIHDGTTGAPLLVLLGHSSDVWDINFSPDGLFILSSSFDGTIRCWSAESGLELWRSTQKMHQAGVKSCHWVTIERNHAEHLHDDSGDGKSEALNIAVSGGMDRGVLLWEVQEQNLVEKHSITRTHNLETPRSLFSSVFNEAVHEEFFINKVTKSFEALSKTVLKNMVYLQDYKSQNAIVDEDTGSNVCDNKCDAEVLSDLLDATSAIFSEYWAFMRSMASSHMSFPRASSIEGYDNKRGEQFSYDAASKNYLQLNAIIAKTSSVHKIFQAQATSIQERSLRILSSSDDTYADREEETINNDSFQSGQVRERDDKFNRFVTELDSLDQELQKLAKLYQSLPKIPSNV